MSLFIIVGIYFYIRGITSIAGKSIFYTNRSMELIEEERIPEFLKEIGKIYLYTGTVFTIKGMLDLFFWGNHMISIVFFVFMIICVVFLARCNEKYLKKPDLG